MPTGYTHAVCDGKVTEFAEFAMQCARAMGACITMRDDPFDAPIPDKFQPSDYHNKSLAEAKKRLAGIEAMTPKQIAAAAEAAYNEALASHKRYEAEEQLSDQRLEAMLEKVRAWQPPTAEHVGFKDFMLKQLRISKRGSYQPEPPKWLTPEEWQREEIERLSHDIGYHAAQYAKEVERARASTVWVKALRESLV